MTTEMKSFVASRPYELKIKAKSLAAEAVIIRQEESKALRFARRLEAAGKNAERQRAKLHSLKDHRLDDVRCEARSTSLARAFLIGMPYARVEKLRYSNPEWAKIFAMVQKYGTNNDPRSLAQGYEQWKQAAGTESPVKTQ